MTSHRDPTAHTAIGNVMRDAKMRPQPRSLAEKHPDLFAGLSSRQARELGVKAWRISGGGSVTAITRVHLEQAKAAL